jgi:hypothetical protein
MEPESVEIKVTISAQVADAVTSLDLGAGKNWRIAFCEDVTAAVSPSTPLLDLGVVLRARRKSASKGDSTIKLRPCRWSQLDDDFTRNSKIDGADFKIEADWAGSRHSLAAAMTVDWQDGRLDQVSSGELPAEALFDQRQLNFLARCGSGRVNPAIVTALPTFEAVRWDAFTAAVGSVELSIRAERWTILGGNDFLELSVVGDVADATRRQEALEEFVASRSLLVDRSEENKTQRVLSALIAAAARPRQ